MKKNLTKILSLVMITAMVLGLSACGTVTVTTTTAGETTETSAKPVSLEDVKSREDMISAGYIEGMTSGSDGKLAIEFTNQDNTEFYALGWKLTDAQCDEYWNIDVFADGADAKRDAVLAEADGPVVVYLNDFIPDLTGYEGKTFTDLETEGCIYSYMSEDEDGTNYAIFDTDDYEIFVYSDDIPEGIEAYKDDLDWSSFVVSNVVFGSFGSPENLVFSE